MPKEPSLEEVNNYVDPIVIMLQRNYEQGVHFTTTFDNPVKGQSSRSMVAVHVFDLPGAKKILGHCSYTSKHNFCSYCHLSKSDIDNFDWQTWHFHTVEELRSAAEQWRDAPSAAARKKLYKKNGVRWSTMWGLSYFNPCRSVIVDGMHNLFEGLVQYHIRTVLGLDCPIREQEEESKPADPQQLASATELLDRKPSQHKLKRLSVPVLKVLCSQKGIALPVAERGKRLKKASIVSTLLSSIVSLTHYIPSCSNTRTQETQETPTNHSPSHPAIQSQSAPAPATSRATQDEMLVGDGYIEEVLAVPVVGDDIITDKELSHLHKFLSQTTRPSWHAAPPSNLGEKKHGKLKADQLRSCIEFDIPTAIAQLWAEDTTSDNESARRRKKLVDSTILLATAI